MPTLSTYALWVSHSSINDFLSCPRAYYLKHIYKDPKTKQKINIITPSIALGLAVHDTLESLVVPLEERFIEPLEVRFEKMWEKVAGKLGGFLSDEEEELYKTRGLGMIGRVSKKPGPLLQKALKLHTSENSFVPHFLLSKEENVILCGKIDWMEYLPENNSVHIIDFKTGKHEEKAHSLQLPIYCLLVKNLQGRNIHKVSYWYLDKDDDPTEIPMRDIAEEKETILDVARRMRMVRDSGKFKCTKGECFACIPFEAIIRGNATFVKKSDYQDIYFVHPDLL